MRPARRRLVDRVAKPQFRGLCRGGAGRSRDSGLVRQQLPGFEYAVGVSFGRRTDRDRSRAAERTNVPRVTSGAAVFGVIGFVSGIERGELEQQDAE